MKETLQAMDWNSIIKKYFVDLVEVVKSGVDFASKEVPLYLKELIAYEFWHAALWAVAYAFFAGVSIWAMRKFYRRFKKVEGTRDENEEGVIWIMSTVFTLIIGIVFAVNSIQEVDIAIKAAVAPRVIIVEKIQSLIKDTTSNSCSQK